MIFKQKLYLILLLLPLIVSAFLVARALPVAADSHSAKFNSDVVAQSGKDPGESPRESGKAEGKKSVNGECGSGYTKIGFPIEGDNDCLPNGSGDQNVIYIYIRAIVRFLSAGVGLVIVIMIIWGGIQWITSAGNPQGIAAARSRIVNALIALFLFLFMFAILNFLVPGGLLT